MSPEKTAELWAKLFVIAPYLASLIAVGVVFGWALLKFRTEIRRELIALEQRIDARLKKAISREQTESATREIISPVTAGLNHLKTMSAQNSESLKQIDSEIKQLTKGTISSEVKLDGIVNRLNRVEDKVYND